VPVKLSSTKTTKTTRRKKLRMNYKKKKIGIDKRLSGWSWREAIWRKLWRQELVKKGRLDRKMKLNRRERQNGKDRGNLVAKRSKLS
jgi:hypothetical protein